MKKPSRRVLLAFIICIVLAVASSIIWYRSTYTWINNVRHRRDDTYLDLSNRPLPSLDELQGFRGPQVLDLRGTDLTASQYNQLADWYPQCQILWNVPFQGSTLDSTVTNLRITTLSDLDIEVLDYLPELERIDAAGCMDYPQLTALQERRPNLELDYTVRIGQTDWALNTKTLSIANADPEELLERFTYLPALESVELTGQLPAPALLLELCQRYPNLDIGWSYSFGPYTVTQETTFLELSGWQPENADSLRTAIAYAPNLQSLTVLGSGLSNAELADLQSSYPNLNLVWDMILGEKTFRTDVERLDLSNVPLACVSDLEELFQYLPNLNWVDVSFCGLSNEELDALNQRHKDIRVVWTVTVSYTAPVRTDATYFMAYQFNLPKYIRLENLKYCTDIICIDIGHYTVSNIDFVRAMPHLQYLIIADTPVSSLEPLRGLQELIYLECFLTPISDFSPLLDCPALLDLNVCWTPGSVEPLKELTQLERLWVYPTSVQIRHADTMMKELQEALPNTLITYVDYCTGNHWRDHPRYRQMRDILGMFYMT